MEQGTESASTTSNEFQQYHQNSDEPRTGHSDSSHDLSERRAKRMCRQRITHIIETEKSVESSVKGKRWKKEDLQSIISRVLKAPFLEASA